MWFARPQPLHHQHIDTKPQHKVSWRHPRSKHWHQFDLLLMWRRDLGSIKSTHSFQSANCDTDLPLVICKVKLQPKKIYRAKKERWPRIDTSNTCNLNKVKEFVEALENALPGQVLTPVRDGHTSGTPSTTLWCPPSARGRSSQLTGLRPTQKNCYPLIKEKQQAFSAYNILTSWQLAGPPHCP